MRLSRSEHKHLLFRAGFGPDLAAWQSAGKPSRQEAVKQLFARSQRAEPLSAELPDTPDAQDLRAMSQEQRQELIKQNRESIRALNVLWLSRMATSEAQLREKMTFFWHDHFACRLHGARLVQWQNNTLRTHALGKFGELLSAIARDPGMLQFLNNQQNRKEHPNENFAREVMELFTLGRGHYSEQDIREAARAFTGWGFRPLTGEFVFRKQQHDYGSKTFLGKTGNFDGQDILDILLEQRQTARFLTAKLCRFLLHPDPEPEQVEAWAKRFYESGYDISGLLEHIFLSDAFYSSRNLGARIKSPVEYIVSLMRLLDLQFQDESSPVLIQRALGQMLFDPPSVAGWPEGRNWIDSSSMLARLRIPEALVYAAELDMEIKGSFAGNEEVAGDREGFKRRLDASIRWEGLSRHLARLSGPARVQEAASYLLQAPQQRLSPDTLSRFVRGEDEPQEIKSLVLRLVCTPEFQLC
jgi:uncharacterized protein (DUF1800 family)